jgi:hypothetical protein
VPNNLVVAVNSIKLDALVSAQLAIVAKLGSHRCREVLLSFL